MSSRETVEEKAKEIGDHVVDGQKALNLTC
jgi:hypothetical protein